jgi:steroid delta-isomerase-like uncharacterized protein
MSLEENKAIVLRFVDEVQCQHYLATVDELFSADFVNHSGPPDLRGPQSVREFFTMMFAAFPDMHFTVRQQIAEGDKVLTHKTFHGTHRGPFMGIPATGKEVSIDVMDILTVRDGKIREHWTVSDMLGMLQQLGVAPGS